ncbi:MAG: MarR family transcriptional regulator, partial [Actinobacteria bacterium]|nr:MarR family transcriptional regulator [Actinomycetota bacterium]
VGLLDELELDGYIERRRDQADRRRQTVEITASGRKALGQLRRLAARLEDEFLAELSAEDRRELHTLLLRLGRQHMPQCRVAAPPEQP